IDVSGLSRRAQIPIDQAVIYPNIVRLDDPDSARHVFHIGKVSEPVSVTIYTIEGTEVCTSTERDDGDVVWSLGTPDCLQSEGGCLAASGVYLARIKSSTGSVMRPIVVIR